MIKKRSPIPTAAKKEPVFKPKPGQVDFTHARYCPTLNCVVRHKGAILLVKRPSGMRLYPGLWGGITGFLDDRKTLEEKAAEELREELGIGRSKIISIRTGRVMEIASPEYRKVWITHPVLADVATERVKLNWESEEACWIDPGRVGEFRCVPGFKESLRDLLRMVQ